MALNYKSYIDKHLVPEIVEQLENEELMSFTAENCTELDGFMSVLYSIRLKTKTTKGVKERLLLAKFLRGDEAFRESTKSYLQAANEIYVYSTVLPQYDKLLKDLRITSVNVMDFVPHTYKAKFGYIEGLSTAFNQREISLVMENLKPLGYQLGSRPYLDRNHLLAMSKPLGQYHALSYALRALDNCQLEKLKSGIIPLRFINEDDPEDYTNNYYRVLYRYAFDRFYEFYDRKIDTNTFDKKSKKDLKLLECLNKLREKYFVEPTQVSEKIRTKIEDNEEDRKFAAILHGDYTRNNILFKYKMNQEAADNRQEHKVENTKMLDFQLMRYGSPALDLSFFMYFNINETMRSELWLDILKTYHSSMFSTLSTILKATDKPKQEIDDILSHYSFEKFQAHFSRFALFGVMVCWHFLPWMLCSKEECSRMSQLFATDLYGEEFRKLSLEAGGDETNMRLLAIVRHACEMGYMDYI